MKSILRGAALGAILISPWGLASAAAQTVQKAPKIEVCFVLDTTGSMSQLIEGAKQKIWSIANRMASAKPTPAIRLGLIGYRDRGDEYITKVFDLTEDLDAIYSNLIAFRAAGGGDQPESVNQALFEAVTKVTWSKDRETLKLIFLVGDAPPHMDYANDVQYPETARMAATADIVINTIQAGNIVQTTPFWQEIASKSDGQFVRIDQSGGMRAATTPMDADLTRLSRELSLTVVPYGDVRQQAAVNSKNAASQAAVAGGGADGRGARGGGGRGGAAAPAAAAAAADAASAAERLNFLNREAVAVGAKTVVTGDGELIRDIANGKIKLEDVKEADLPPNMQQMTVEERRKYVAEQLAKRKELQTKVDELAKQRDEYVKAEMKKAAETGDSFDAKVADMVKSQAQKKGIAYENATPAAAKK